MTKDLFEKAGLSIIDRYVLKDFLLTLLLILASLTVLYLIVDFFQRVRMFISNDATLFQVGAYFFYNLPVIVVQMVPVSVLLSSLITFGNLSKNCEILAFRASGISLHRLALPLIFCSAAIALFTFVISEYVMPSSNQRVKEIKFIHIQNRPQSGDFKHYEIWYRSRDGIYNFSVFDPRTAVLQGVRIHYLDSSMNLTGRIDAAEGRWSDGSWTLHTVMKTTFPEETFPIVTTMPSMVVDLPEKPEDFLVVQREPDEMGFGELRRYIAKISAEGYDATRYLVDLHAKAAFPFVSVIMVVFGLCFAVRLERSGGIAQSIGIGVITGLSYWLIFAFAVSLGHSGALSPLVSAWAANGVFLAASLTMLCRLRT